MVKETVDVLIEGGKATAAPPLGPALGPMGVNIGQVISEINKKTGDFKGMRVPVKVIIDKDTKEFDIKVGTPPTSELIKKEAGIETASANPKMDLVADLKIEQIIKVSKMKKDSLLSTNNTTRVLEILGTCQSMGIMVEGKRAHEVIVDIKENGAYKDKIIAGKTELTAEELKAIEIEKKRLHEEIEKRRKEFETRAQDIIKASEGKEKRVIRKALEAAGIPAPIINELVPEEKKETAHGAAPAKK